MLRRSFIPYLVLFAGVLIASTSSIMIRLLQAAGVESLAIAAGRLGLAALMLAPIAARYIRAELASVQRRDLGLTLLTGIVLAIHFASWISSLAYTSVASSAALVATNPLWVGLASLFIFRNRLGWGALAGIGLTLLGTLLIGISDSSNPTQSNPTLGNALALCGAITVSGYLLMGRELQKRLSLLAYITLVYSTAAIVLLFWAFSSGNTLIGFPLSVYALLFALAAGPQLLGHTAFNYALNTLSATFVAVAILGEPVGSALLALFIFHEGFERLQLAGFVLLLLGIYVAARDEARAARKAVRVEAAEV